MKKEVVQLAEVSRILFVCLGNIVRSPLAENLFRHLAEQAGVGDKYVVDSAGTSAWHIGEAPDSRMRRVAAQHGLQYDGRARQVSPQDLEHFDLLIALDNENRLDLLNLAGKAGLQAKIRTLREFDPQGGPRSAVPDPYYGGIDGFEEVFRIVERSCRGLLQALERDGLELRA